MVFCGTPHHPFSTPKGRSRYKYIYIYTQTSTLQRILFEPCFGLTSYDTPTPIHSWHPYRVRVDITPEFSVLVFWFPVFPRISRNNGGTKLIILCSPGNPTGGVWVPEISKQKKLDKKYWVFWRRRKQHLTGLCQWISFWWGGELLETPPFFKRRQKDMMWFWLFVQTNGVLVGHETSAI